LVSDGEKFNRRKLINYLLGATLTRFYGIHAAILPAITKAWIGIHLLLVQKHGMSAPPGIEGRNLKTMKFFFPIDPRD
jgi:quinol-cytochrome oxidoreductase complex cytochrome b subunit